MEPEYQDEAEHQDEMQEGAQVLNLEHSEQILLERRGNAVEQKERRTTRYMTKYERARILGTRALQIRYVLVRNTL
jgi:DNA-directed RNA polymerase I, II, and III subunit RPABC2